MWTRENAPATAKDLVAAALTTWLKIANAALTTYGDTAEGVKKAIATAWAGLKDAGWSKGEDGKWAHTKKATDGEFDADTFLVQFTAQEAAKAAQKARAAKYGIAVKEGGHVTKPSEWSQVGDDGFLDPVNYRYPCPNADQTRAAASYWGKPDNRAQYSSEEQAKITARLEAKKKKFGIAQDQGKKDLVDSAGQTHTIAKTKVLVTGTHTDRAGNDLKVDIPYLDHLVANFNKLANVLKPPLKLGHDAQSILKRSGFPAAGWIGNLWREGESLFARLDDLPDKVFQLIQRKAYRRKSSEIRGDFTHEGTRYGPVFWALALVGEEIPAIKTLDDILALTDEDDCPSLFLTISAKEGGEEMPFTQEDLDRAAKKAADRKEEELTAQFTEKEKGLKDEADKTTADLKAKTAELDEKRAGDQKTKIAAFTERLAEAKVATVFTKESGLATFLEGLDTDDVVQFTDGDDGKATAMDFAIAFTEKLIKAAKDDKLFVNTEELAPGDQGDAVELVDGEKVSTDEAASAKRMIDSQKHDEVKL